MIRRSRLLPYVEYRYSGLSFLVYPEMISQITGTSYEKLLYSEVFKPLGASRLVYNPLEKGFSKGEIPPTEMDLFYRESQVHGRVHDEAAAVFGGVSGNAGLFGNANDLGKLMQMYLNKGSYGGQQLLPEQVVNEFTCVQFPENENRRGLGFDKPLLNNDSKEIDEAYPAEVPLLPVLGTAVLQALLYGWILLTGCCIYFFQTEFFPPERMLRFTISMFALQFSKYYMMSWRRQINILCHLQKWCI